MWHNVVKANVGILSGVNSTLCKLQVQKPSMFPDFGNDGTLLIASDYSGQHSAASYEAYSFVFTTLSRWQSWEQNRLSIRGQYLLSRRMSFKKLEDKKRWEVLPLFLGAASLLEGITISLIVHKSIGSLFSTDGKLNLNRPDLAEISSWKLSVVEKLLRIIHFMMFLICGFSHDGQNIIWISDEDEIFANEERLRKVTSLAANVFSNLSDHELGHLRVGTTASDNGTKQLEDLAAIADLSAGALVEVMTELEEQKKETVPNLLIPMGDTASRKAQSIMVWLSTRELPHQHIIVAMDPGKQKGQVNLRRMIFENIERPRF